MRMLALTATVLLGLAAAGGAQADSWMPPQPMISSSEDGRWYVIVEPVEGVRNARFRLVARAKGKPPRASLPRVQRDRASAGSPKLEPGDRLVATGSCTMPMEVRCLNGGKGLVLFENYGAIGFGHVLDVRDGKGKPRFTKKLIELFPSMDMTTFQRTVGSIWWYSGWWVDEEAGEVVLLWKGREDKAGVLRVRLKNGTTHAGKKTDVLARFSRGLEDERILALKQAVTWKLPGVTSAAADAFDDQAAPPLVRLHMAKLLIERGDARGKAFFASQARTGEGAARVFAVQHLPMALVTEAIPILKEAMRSEEKALRDASEYAFRHMAAKAVPTLIAMLEEAGAPATYRAGAAMALWNMPVEDALPAEAALAKAAKSKDKPVAYAAGHALERIRKHKGK